MSPESPQKLKVVLCWHMHQPQYQNLSSKNYKLPWTYLHGIKDYVDMAELLERQADAKAVVNFSPVLLDQIEEYANQVQGFLQSNKAITDPLLAALVDPALPKDEEHYLALIKQCLKANEQRFIARFAPYQELANLAKYIRANTNTLSYTNGQYLADLITWYHLAWMAETTRKDDDRVKQLISKAKKFSMHDRHMLLKIIGEQLTSIIPRYRRLVQNGQAELCMSPYAHPIVPLLVDFAVALEAMPDSPLPNAESYPGGKDRAEWHLQYGIQRFEHHFGFRPKGCWPSEGALSDDTVKLLEENDFSWCASGQQILQNSLNQANLTPQDSIHRSYELEGAKIRCFFRDDHLSDMIGFTYQNWHGDDAVNNLIHHLETIASSPGNIEEKVVPIILDGENCWEYYPENGYYFITGLYDKLAQHPGIELTTFAGCLNALLPATSLPHIVSGSWVYGTLSTWIGGEDKNKAWDALVKAKRTYDQLIDSNELNEEQRQSATDQLAICEGSDWFWWFGDYNPAESVSDFEALFREHLCNLYRFLGQDIPEELTRVISRGSGEPENAGVMRRSQ